MFFFQNPSFFPQTQVFFPQPNLKRYTASNNNSDYVRNNKPYFTSVEPNKNQAFNNVRKPE